MSNKEKKHRTYYEEYNDPNSKPYARMTKQEKRAYHRSQLKSTHGKDRIVYIWTYYKLFIIMAIVFVIVGLYALQAGLQSRYKSQIYMAIVNSTECNAEGMMDDFQDYEKDENKFHTYDAEVMALSADGMGEMDFTGRFRLTAFTSNQIYDLVILDQETYAFYKDNENFMPVDEFLEEYPISEVKEDQIYQNLAISISEEQMASKYKFNTTSGPYIMINSHSEHLDVVADYIRFMVK